MDNVNLSPLQMLDRINDLEEYTAHLTGQLERAVDALYWESGQNSKARGGLPVRRENWISLELPARDIHLPLPGEFQSAPA